MVMIRKRFLMPQNLTKKRPLKSPKKLQKSPKKLQKKPQNSRKKPQKAKKGPKFKKKPKKPEKVPKKPKKARNFKIAKKARIFLGHSVQDCSKRTLVYMGIFFIEAVKKSPGIKILSLLISYNRNHNLNCFEKI